MTKKELEKENIYYLSGDCLVNTYTKEVYVLKASFDKLLKEGIQEAQKEMIKFLESISLNDETNLEDIKEIAENIYNKIKELNKEVSNDEKRI